MAVNNKALALYSINEKDYQRYSDYGLSNLVDIYDNKSTLKD